ncbi:sphingoid long chain base kinase-like protein [Nemania sp. NC0429]|nr:sphingoid long chain base kinase-like protein [Nemania sp. NC0429]
MSESESVSLVAQPNQSHVLAFGNGISLSLRGDTLVVVDRELVKRNRTKLCGVAIGKPPAEIAIPYYDVLWASVDNNELIVIDYAAHKSKTHLEHAKIRYPLGEVPPATAQTWAEALLNHAYGAAQRQRRAKVLINPHAGPGGAVRKWEREVKPLFEAARMTLDVLTTTHGGQGIEICEGLDVDAYDVVVVCSGDGLVFEVFNGLGRRPDARAALQKVAVAHIPCGSGNAMSCNLNGSYFRGPSALAVVKGVRTSVDLMSFTQGSRRSLSFLSQSVGIIAECDLGTENMRWLGAKRFEVGIAQRIFSKKVYPCDIAIKVEIESKDQIKAHYKRIRHGAEQDHDNDNGGRESMAGTSLSTSDSKPDAGDGLPPLRFGTVSDKIPEDWQTIPYDKLGNFYCGNMAWMAPDANFFPAACMNDGLMDVVVNDGDIPAAKYISLMTSAEDGKIFDNPLVSYRKVVAYRFTPRNQADGYISVDGERMPFEPFQVEIHPGLGTVLSKSGRYEAQGPPNWEKSV